MKTIRDNSKSDNTRQFIIEKVAPVFNMKGYSGTSLSDLTAATGLTKGSIYGNFKNKDAVAIEAFKYNLSIIVRSFNIEIAKAHSSIDKLMALPKVYRRIYKDIIKIGGCPILNTSTDADDTHPQLKELSKNALINLQDAIESLIDEGIQKKEIKADVNADKIAGLFLSLIEGGFLISKVTGITIYFENALVQIEDLIKQIKL